MSRGPEFWPPLDLIFAMVSSARLLDGPLSSVVSTVLVMQADAAESQLGAARTMSPEELADLLARFYSYPGWFELSRGPLLAVLDTSCVRTGLHYQLRNGTPPASITTAQDSSIRLLMEYDTLVETNQKLPKFAKGLGVSTDELRRILNEDWLPYITVVRLPPELRQADERALAVRACDPDDYPAAALAAVLSPCILLTHNYTDFGALGVRTESQGVDGILAGINLRVGQMHLNVLVLVPVAPVRAAIGGTKWVYQKVGPYAWLILGGLVLLGILIYSRQPPERRERIKQSAIAFGKFMLDEATKASAEVAVARTQLTACVVPGPPSRTPEIAAVRALAAAEESLSAQQLAELLDESVRPPVAQLRAYLRANNETMVYEVRRGGFVLGSQRYKILASSETTE